MSHVGMQTEEPTGHRVHEKSGHGLVESVPDLGTLASLQNFTEYMKPV